MRKSSFFLTTLLLYSFPATAQTTISGDISGQTFKPSGNPWVVKENIYIESGEKTIIKPGCIFLFKPFTGLVVQGSLEVEGQPDAPVIFTSINDTAYNEASTQNAEPFDWNGISYARLRDEKRYIQQKSTGHRYYRWYTCANRDRFASVETQKQY